MDTNDSLKNLNRHFEKMSNAIHHFADIYRENTHKLPFWKTKTFWSLVVVVSSLFIGFASLYYTSRDALSLVETYNIHQKMDTIRDFKAYENKAILKARITIINQTLQCPVTDVHRLRQMKIDRNNTLISIMAFNSGLNVGEDKKIRSLISAIVDQIYDLDVNDICKIKVKPFDHKLEVKLTALDSLINTVLLDYEHQTTKLKF